MSRPAPIEIQRDRNSGLVAPVTYAVRAAVQRIGSPSMWDARARVLRIPVQHVDDLAAALEHAGLRVNVSEAGA